MDENESLILIRANCTSSWYVCQLPASYTSTASYIIKRPITPGLLYKTLYMIQTIFADC